MKITLKDCEIDNRLNLQKEQEDNDDSKGMLDLSVYTVALKV